MTNYQANTDKTTYIRTANDLMDFITKSPWPFNFSHSVCDQSHNDVSAVVEIVKATCPTSSNYPLTFVCINGAISSVTDGKEICTNVLFLSFSKGDLAVYWITPDGKLDETKYMQWR